MEVKASEKRLSRSKGGISVRRDGGWPSVVS